MPYLAAAPDGLTPLDPEVPALQPGESVELPVTLPAPAGDGRQVAWISLDGADGTPLSASGSPALQLGNAGP